MECCLNCDYCGRSGGGFFAECLYRGFQINNEYEECCDKYKPKYDFDCGITEEYQNYTNHDEWGCATLWLNDKQGVEYNFCMDGGLNSCAIYKMEMNDDSGYVETDYSIYEHYEINFDDVEWQEGLKKAMYKVAKKFFNKEV